MNAKIERLVLDGQLEAAHTLYQSSIGDGVSILPLTTSVMMELCMLQQDAELGLRYVGAQAERDDGTTETMIELLMRLGSVRPAMHLLAELIRTSKN